VSPAARRRPDPEHRDEGSEIVEFTLVSILVVIIVAAVFQLALTLHVRNTLISCAAEGARLATAEDRSLGEGEARAESLASDSLSGYPVEAQASVTVVGGAPIVVITMTAPVPVVGLWGFGSMRVEARAFKEVDRG
jgi:Flp pilus assembly protein TadG